MGMGIGMGMEMHMEMGRRKRDKVQLRYRVYKSVERGQTGLLFTHFSSSATRFFLSNLEPV